MLHLQHVGFLMPGDIRAAPVHPLYTAAVRHGASGRVGRDLRRPVFAHRDDAGCAVRIGDHQRPVALSVGPDLHHLFRIADARGRPAGAELAGQFLMHRGGWLADRLGNGRDRRGRRGEESKQEEGMFGHAVECNGSVTICIYKWYTSA